MLCRLHRCLAASTLLAALALGAPPDPAAAEDYEDFADLDLESLLDRTITTAAKHEQKISDTPVAATVITADEIAASGARSIPEVLYRVAGLDVIQSSSSSYDVSARGLNKLGSNAMLVLIDGRSVYEEFYGLTIWEMLTVGIDDIKAIEVIKGPGSAMYGANAFAGVINILTFAPGESSGTGARAFVSDLGESQGSLRTAGSQGALGWNAAALYDRSVDWETDLPEAESTRIDGRLSYDLGHDRSVALEGGAYDGTLKLIPSNAALAADAESYYVRTDVSLGDFEARWYMNELNVVVEPVEGSLIDSGATMANSLQDIEFNHSFAPTGDTFILWGGQYRHKQFDYSPTEGTIKQDIWAAYALGEWQPHQAWLLSLGVRYEHHPQVGGAAAPRGGVVFKPHSDHALRLSYSQAYRDPSYVESYWHADAEVLPGLVQVYRGDPDLESEEIRSFEVGYQGLVTPGVLVTVAVFHNDMDRLIEVTPIADFPVPPAPYPGIPSELAFQNVNSWNATGGEITVEANPASWLRLSGFYAYDWMEDSDTGAHVEQAPLNTAYARSVFRCSPRHDLLVTWRYRSATTWDVDGFTLPGDERLVFDLHWHVDLEPDGHRFAFGVENIFDRRYRDHPLAIEQRRRVMASVKVQF